MMDHSMELQQKILFVIWISLLKIILVEYWWKVGIQIGSHGILIMYIRIRILTLHILIIMDVVKELHLLAIMKRVGELLIMKGRWKMHLNFIGKMECTMSKPVMLEIC